MDGAHENSPAATGLLNHKDTALHGDSVAQNIGNINIKSGAETFLGSLWGADVDGRLPGVHFIGSLNPGGGPMTHSPVSTISEALTKAGEISGAGRNAYFACAQYLTPDNRKGENAAGAYGFWFDIDCGEAKAAEGKGYLTKTAAKEALVEFCGGVGLPHPSIIVDSGNGLHCYWHFKIFINRERWRELAGKLKKLAARHGFLADPSRTADIASVLRAPGTTNWKDPSNPKPVTVKRLAVAVNLDAFAAALDVAMPDEQAPPTGKNAALAGGLEYPQWEETPENIKKVRDMLAAIPADCDRETWRNICWAVLATGWTCAENLAREWSMTA